MARPALYDRPMTPAERKARSRAAKQAEMFHDAQLARELVTKAYLGLARTSGGTPEHDALLDARDALDRLLVRIQQTS